MCQAYFARIDEVNLKGPALRAVLELNPSALTQAAALDKERKLLGTRSALHGIPILLKVARLSLSESIIVLNYVRTISLPLRLKVSEPAHLPCRSINKETCRDEHDSWVVQSLRVCRS